jgi:hypothetical protein
MRVPLFMALASAFLAACGGSSGNPPPGSDGGGQTGDSGLDAGVLADSGTDGGMGSDAGPPADGGGTADSGAPGDSGFVLIPRTDWPVFQNPSGNPILADVQLVTITFEGYPFQTNVEALGDFIVTSPWFQEIGRDYGIDAGTHIGKYRFSDYDAGATATLSDANVESFIQGKISSAALPTPNAETLFMVYFPASITISNGAFGSSCTNFDGYHKADTAVTPSFAYAVINDCSPGTSDELPEIEMTASHELAEAATDPFPNPLGKPAYQIRDLTSPWLASQIIAEIGDVCEGQRIQVDGPDAGYTLQQIWSTSAAAANQAPCIPADPARPYFGITVSPASVQTSAAGSTVTFNVTGWSSGPFPAWEIQQFAEPGPLTSFTPTVSFGALTLDNGVSSPLGVTIPSSATAGSSGVVMFYSSPPGSPVYSRWPVVVSAQ